MTQDPSFSVESLMDKKGHGLHLEDYVYGPKHVENSRRKKGLNKDTPTNRYS